MRTSKGIVFSIDALLAAIILSLFAAGLAYLSASAVDDGMGRLLAKEQSSDLLLALDKSGALESMDGERIAAAMDASVAPSDGYSLRLEYYEYAGEFLPAESMVLERGTAPPSSRVGESRRSFVAFHEGSQPYYGVAALSLWRGSA